MGKNRMLVLMTLVLGGLICTSPAWGEEPLAWKNLSLEATAGWDYNTNPGQQPDNPKSQQFPGGRGSSMVYVNNLRTWYNFNPTGPFDVEARYEYYQTFDTRAQFSQFDVLSHVLTLTPSYLFGSNKAYIAISYNYTDVDSSKYETFYALQPRLFRRFSEEVGVEVGMNMARESYWTPLNKDFFVTVGPTNLGKLDRSNRRIGPQLGFFYFIGDKGTLQAQFNYDNVNAVGRNFQGERWHLLLNGLYQIHPRINVNLFIDLGLEPYYHRSIDGSPNVFPARNDQMINLGAIISADLYKGLGCNVHYYFTRVNSNFDLYEYHTHVIGFLLSYKK
jgi:hypothetical protein